ncbi:MAG: response regulator receiver protein [Cytophagaceae bacterium]|jgi:CheY-like chemotaxis protein|nr:response regulator receiver protein [Cytophagaceae bacterium]
MNSCQSIIFIPVKHASILLVDDDEDDQEIFFAALEELSYPGVFKPLSSAIEALKLLKGGQVKPDLIFLDLNMPIMNGQQFLKEIKNTVNAQHIPVIIISTSSNPQTIQQTKELGAYDFVTKPDKFDELVNKLKPLI